MGAGYDESYRFCGNGLYAVCTSGCILYYPNSRRPRYNAVTAIDARDSGTDVNSVGSYTDVSGDNSAGSNSGGSGDNSAGSNSDGTTAIDARDSGTDVNSVGSYTDVSGDNSAGSNSNGVTAINARDSGTDVNSVGSYTEVTVTDATIRALEEKMDHVMDAMMVTTKEGIAITEGRLMAILEEVLAIMKSQ